MIADSSYQADRDRARGQRLPARPARIPDHPAGHGADHRLRRDRLRPLASRRARRRRRRRHADAGTRPEDRASSATSGTASTTCRWATPMPRRRPGSRKEPFDFFHVNSIDLQHDGDLLIDARNTWAAYDIDPHTGQVRWRLGGKHSSFTLGPGTRTAYQHDARRQPNGNITFFDNGATPTRAPAVAGDRTGLDTHAHDRRRSCARAEHAPPLVAGSQGNMQALGGRRLDGRLGAGALLLANTHPSGQLLFDAHLPATYESYRTFRQPWSGQPSAPPSLALVAPAHAPRRSYASWNGATGVASWRVLAGATAPALTPLASAAAERLRDRDRARRAGAARQLRGGAGAQRYGRRPRRAAGPEALSADRSSCGGPGPLSRSGVVADHVFDASLAAFGGLRPRPCGRSRSSRRSRGRALPAGAGERLAQLVARTPSRAASRSDASSGAVLRRCCAAPGARSRVE